jgi:polysaccharide biosynthesis/export protein
MRIVHCFLLLTGMAITVGGCAQQPVAYMAYPPSGGSYGGAAYPAPASYPTAAAYPGAGIDHVVYGTGGPYVPAPGAAPMPPAASSVPAGRGLLTSAPAFATAPAPVAAAPAPVRVASAEPMAPAMAEPMPTSTAPPARVASARPAPQAAVAAAPAAMPATRVAAAGPMMPGTVAVPGPTAYVPAVAAPEYTLDSGDRLRVVVFGQEGLTNAYLVDAAGLIDMPLIGQVGARGGTTSELANRIAAKLRNGFIREPHVAVEVVAYRPFFILGEVTAPGQYPYVPRMTAETAVAIAGGFTPRAFRRNLTVDRPVAGRIVRMSVPPSFPLRPGDTVNVQERWF